MTAKRESASHQALYRKYRPRSLDEFVGQSHVVEILRRSLKKGKIAHAYLLTGPKGTGKTTIARILAHDINQLPYDDEATHLDIIEIDAASNNGVDDVRDLRDKVRLAPTSAAKKIYIIDEVHMLSKPAFNALLKTLEEPPAHVVFILATTDLHKVPATIISRTQHFTIRTYSTGEVMSHLRNIADAEGIKISDDALELIAKRGEGSFRNSISLLDQLASYADDTDGITLELVESTLGLAPTDAVTNLLSLVNNRDVARIVMLLDQLEQEGIQPVILADQLIQELRSQLADRPQSVALLDSLLSVTSSPQPQLKLLTVLAGAAAPPLEPTQHKVAAAAITKPSVIVEVPVTKTTKPKNETSTLTPSPKDKKETAIHSASKKRSTKSTTQSVLNWDKLVEHTRQHMLALYSVLSKCEYELEGDVLTLYAGRKFNKTKLDEAKYLAQLHEALQATEAGGFTIETLATTKPPKDEALAKVAAIMGGGREVQVGDEGSK